MEHNQHYENQGKERAEKIIIGQVQGKRWIVNTYKTIGKFFFNCNQQIYNQIFQG